MRRKRRAWGSPGKNQTEPTANMNVCSITGPRGCMAAFLPMEDSLAKVCGIGVKGKVEREETKKESRKVIWDLETKMLLPGGLPEGFQNQPD